MCLEDNSEDEADNMFGSRGLGDLENILAFTCLFTGINKTGRVKLYLQKVFCLLQVKTFL